VPKNSAARFIEQEIAKYAVTGNETGLLPQTFAGGRRNTAYDDVADLPFGMARYEVDNLGCLWRYR
jgi:hypothetical protein